MTQLSQLPPPARRVFCNRTLNMRAISAVGFDMDYTLIHYHPEQWEERAYDYARARLAEQGLAVDGLRFDPELVRPGLVFDFQEGNVVKANRFGFVKRSCHGTRMLDFDAQRELYSRVLINLGEPRWKLLDTLFSLSEACLFMQLVDRLDENRLAGVHGYEDLYRTVRGALNAAHMEDAIKADIVRDPRPFVDLDEELPLALLDLKHAGKQLLLITNSEYGYTRAMMTYAFDRFLPAGQSWKDLFDLVIVSAKKPGFFEGESPALRVVDDAGLLSPHHGPLEPGGVYWGANARLVERSLGLRGEQILYIGDHIYADVHVSKNVLRWRTGLVSRAIEDEVEAEQAFADKQAALSSLMSEKEALEHGFSQARLSLQRLERGYGPQTSDTSAELKQHMRSARDQLLALDQRIAELAAEASSLGSERWGPLLRAGNDKSKLARQIERYADVYTSRVSNLLAHTPFVYLRAPRGSMPHDV